MALTGCGFVYKLILILINIILLVLGSVFLGLGLWLRFSGETGGIFTLSANSYDEKAFQSNAFQTGVNVLISLGLVMVIVGVFGEFCVHSEKGWALQLLSVILFFLAVAESLVGILPNENRDKIGKELGELYTAMYGHKDHDPSINNTLKFIHNLLHCCGPSGVKPVGLEQTCPKSDGSPKDDVTPHCPETILNIFVKQASLVMGIFTGIGALLVVGVVCSAVLSSLVLQTSSVSLSVNEPVKHRPLPIPPPFKVTNSTRWSSP